MPGSIVDLSLPGSSVPDPIVVDTNIIAEYLLASFFVPTVFALRASQFFNDLIANNGTGVVTPTAFTEFVHVAVRVKYNQEFARMTVFERKFKYGYPVKNWAGLYKQDPTILRAFLPDLHTLRNLLIANGLLFVAPEELGSIASGRRHDEEIVDLMGAYGLDSSDAAILLEARRCGLTDIIGFDADMQRAQPDFNIYTWI